MKTTQAALVILVTLSRFAIIGRRKILNVVAIMPKVFSIILRALDKR